MFRFNFVRICGFPVSILSLGGSSSALSSQKGMAIVIGANVNPAEMQF